MEKTICENAICIVESENDNEIIIDSDSEDLYEFKFDVEMIIWTTVHVILLVFIIGGNLLTIIAVRICRRLRAVVSNLFILSLAVSDLIVGLTLPYHLSFFLGLGLGKSEFLCILRFWIIIFACCISMWNLISIAIDRYIAIMYPLHYRRFITRRVAVYVIALGWMVGAILASVPIFHNHWATATKCEFNEVLPSWYILGIITPVFTLVWICMLFVYLRIWQEAAKQAKQLQTATCCQVLPSDSKSVQVVLLIMGGFSICWLPYFSVACLQIFVQFDACPILYRAALALAMSNSGLNPIIYAWKNSNFRRSFCRLLQCKNPNCANNSDYSVWEHCPRNGSQPKRSSAISCTSTKKARTGSVDSTSPVVVNCDPNPRSMTTDSHETTIEDEGPFVIGLTSRNELTTTTKLGVIPNSQARIFYSPCEVCNILVGTRIKSSKNFNEIILPWNCKEYNHNKIINTIKCRW
ncbi:histamine H2 receptor [Eupeodes corollae]|uniref:histamine H2 receptor n=1 Tax=Eupeodes corollae TaxID=290404 RepID=UPI0024935B78|nr:histamine H2 receptor [Eupeodes corollae]